MPGSATAEIYFIASMMILILLICGVTVYFFAKTYKKEMAEREKRQKRLKEDRSSENPLSPSVGENNTVGE
ncbi:MAG: hypothetical protein KF685_11980 [Acidobacteria bacterium]|nr:hypothetical protein [Acidobacteriota bacterium]